MDNKERELRQELHRIKNEARGLLEAKKTNEAAPLVKRAKELSQQLEGMSKESKEYDASTLNSGSFSYDGFDDSGNQLRALTIEQRMADFTAPDYVNGEQRKLSIGKYVRGIITGNWDGADAERRAMSEGSMSGGGYIVPSHVSAEIIDAARKQTTVLKAGALTIPMETSNLTMAKIEKDPTAHWKKENEPIIESGLTFGAIKFEAKTLVAMVRMSRELLEDANNIDEVVRAALSQSLAVELDRVALLGSGQDPEPLGLLNTVGVQTISLGDNGGEITNYATFSRASEMIKGVNGMPNAAIWSPRTDGVIDRLVDSTGQPLNAPASFNNLIKLATSQIPNDVKQGTATNASLAMIGDWKNLLIGIRKNIEIEVSKEASGSFEKLQHVVRAYIRADVKVARPNHFVTIKGIL